MFRIPLLGFWLTAILLSAGLSRFAAHSLDRRKQRSLARQLGAVDTPHNQGKLGSLMVQQRRYKAAIPRLERAADGEPEMVDWTYRLGIARLGAKDYPGAIDALERAVEANEEHAYGGGLLRLAETYQADGQLERALEVLERFERNHGPNPESAYRRGLALRASGRRDDARAAFREVGELGRQAARYQKKGATQWQLRAWWAALL